MDNLFARIVASVGSGVDGCKRWLEDQKVQGRLYPVEFSFKALYQAVPEGWKF